MRQHYEAGQHDDTNGGVGWARCLDDPRKNRVVAAMQPSYERRLAFLQRHIAQENKAHRRRDGQCDHRGRCHRQRVGEGKWLEKCAGQPFHNEDRQQGHYFDQGRVDDGVANLQRGLENDSRNRRALPLLAMLAETPHDVFDVDDRVIDNSAEGDYEPRQHHGVDRRPTKVEHQRACHQRQRNRGATDQGDTPLVEKGKKNQNHENTGND